MIDKAKLILYLRTYGGSKWMDFKYTSENTSVEMNEILYLSVPVEEWVSFRDSLKENYGDAEGDSEGDSVRNINIKAFKGSFHIGFNKKKGEITFSRRNKIGSTEYDEVKVKMEYIICNDAIVGVINRIIDSIENHLSGKK